jgi:hypothetical protein
MDALVRHNYPHIHYLGIKLPFAKRLSFRYSQGYPQLKIDQRLTESQRCSTIIEWAFYQSGRDQATPVHKQRESAKG